MEPEEPEAKRPRSRSREVAADVPATANGSNDQADKPPGPDCSDEEFQDFVARSLRSTEHLPAEATQPDFQGYKFTGSVRPGSVSPQMSPPEGCCLPDYALHPKGLPRSEFLRSRTKTIPVLEGEDLAKMRQVCSLGRDVLDLAARFLRPGVTGDEIDRVVYAACCDRRLFPSPLNYMGFPKSVCVSVNEVICHGIPDSRPLEEGDIVNLDVSVCFQGFHADLNETFFVGQCDEESHHLVKTTYNALKAASELIRPGTMYRQLGAAIEKEASSHGCSVVQRAQ
ncbi:unnamed protein product [Effrenium voratum]|nr:unnamed protein product [Effrenium voratum]